MLAGKGNHIANLAKITDVWSLGAKSRSGKVPIKSPVLIKLVKNLVM